MQKFFSVFDRANKRVGLAYARSSPQTEGVETAKAPISLPESHDRDTVPPTMLLRSSAVARTQGVLLPI